MRLCRGDAAALLTSVVLAACAPAADSLAPTPGHVVPLPVEAGARVSVAAEGDDRFYVPALDTIRRLRVRVRDASGAPLPGLSVAFSEAGDGATSPIGQATADSLGVVAVPAFVTAATPARRFLRATAEGMSSATYSYLVLPAAYGGPSYRRCPIPPSLLPRYATLARTNAAIARGDSLRIVAIGSSSTEGYMASSPAASYPSRLQERLREALPGKVVSVINRGRGGQSATRMVAAFPADVYANAPHLVIWQTGTIEANEGTPVDAFVATVRGGISELRARGFDVLLMDSQAYPAQPTRYEEYQKALAALAAEQGVPLVTRYQLMRAYVASGRYTATELLASDAFHPNDLTYDCMAHWILAGIMAAQVGGA